MSEFRRDLLVVAGLAAAPTIALGFTRFAYALLLPAMRADLGWSFATAGLMNTVNAGGYLAGGACHRLAGRAGGTATGARLVAGHHGARARGHRDDPADRGPARPSLRCRRRRRRQLRRWRCHDRRHQPRASGPPSAPARWARTSPEAGSASSSLGLAGPVGAVPNRTVRLVIGLARAQHARRRRHGAAVALAARVAPARPARSGSHRIGRVVCAGCAIGLPAVRARPHRAPHVRHRSARAAGVTATGRCRLPGPASGSPARSVAWSRPGSYASATVVSVAFVLGVLARQPSRWYRPARGGHPCFTCQECGLASASSRWSRRSPPRPATPWHRHTSRPPCRCSPPCSRSARCSGRGSPACWPIARGPSARPRRVRRGAARGSVLCRMQRPSATPVPPPTP